ncbi:MAG: ATP/GTP-binding protein [Bacteroidetes bacterium]|nr:ATP/GTP-binding protein [Bacteroidota bacterium]
MKYWIIACFSGLLLCSRAGLSQTHQLTQLWETDTLLRTPESVLYDAKARLLYVSNIEGIPNEKDGKGSIAKVGLDGKIINAQWVTGLNAPKGMGIYKNKLYVADLTEVVVIDMDKATIIERIPVEGSVFLNDITIDKSGAVYVSDTRVYKVYRIDKGFVVTLFQNLQGPNGLLALGDELLILDKGSLVKQLASGTLANITEGMDPSTDGIEQVQKNEYLVSCWNGVIYYIYANGNKQVLLDTRPQKSNTADIGYDAKNRILYVPTFYGNKVVAYQLK